MTDMALDYEPARVHIVKDDTRPASSGRRFCNVVSKSYLAGSAELILPRSAGRRCAHIQIIGKTDGTFSNVVLADSQADAQQQAATPTITGPGALAQCGMFLVITHNDEVWLAKSGSGTAPMVGVIAEYDA
jgi:hypothetical protein